MAKKEKIKERTIPEESNKTRERKEEDPTFGILERHRAFLERRPVEWPEEEERRKKQEEEKKEIQNQKRRIEYLQNEQEEVKIEYENANEIFAIARKELADLEEEVDNYLKGYIPERDLFKMLMEDGSKFSEYQEKIKNRLRIIENNFTTAIGASLEKMRTYEKSPSNDNRSSGIYSLGLENMKTLYGGGIDLPGLLKNDSAYVKGLEKSAEIFQADISRVQGKIDKFATVEMRYAFAFFLKKHPIIRTLAYPFLPSSIKLIVKAATPVVEKELEDIETREKRENLPNSNNKSGS